LLYNSFLRCWFIHALRCSEAATFDADRVVVSSQLVTSGIHKIIQRAGPFAHRFSFQEFSAVFSACSSSSQGLTSGNSTRHLCSLLLQPADYSISEATMHVSLTYTAVSHLHRLLQLRLRAATRVLASFIHLLAAKSSESSAAARIVAKSPVAVDITSDTSDAAVSRLPKANAEIDFTYGSVSRQLVHTLSSPEVVPPSSATVLPPGCFNDDGSPLPSEHVGHSSSAEHCGGVAHPQLAGHPHEDQQPKRNQQLLQQPVQLQNTPRSLSTASPSSASDCVSSLSPAPPVSVPAFAVPRPAFRGQKSSISPVQPASGFSSSHPASSESLHALTKQRLQESEQQKQLLLLTQQQEQQQQQQLSANQQALVDEAVQAARLQVPLFLPESVYLGRASSLFSCIRLIESLAVCCG
jgi:hypothetical protein